MFQSPATDSKPNVVGNALRTMRHLISIFILIGCVNGTVDYPIDSISLNEVGLEINGHWRLVLTENKDGQKIENPDTDKLEYYEFEGLKGINSEMTDNHDGTFGIPTCQPSCRLKEQGSKKIIEYIGLTDQWELEIIELSDDKLVLTDSKSRWTYERQLVKGW